MVTDPVSIVLLAYNEARTIEQEIRCLHEQIIRRLPGSQIIVGEDGSKDGTSQILKKLCQELGIIHSSNRDGSERKGYARAFCDALRRATNDYIFFMDTGNKYNSMDFWRLYDLRLDYDLIVGRRTKRHDPVYRRCLTACYNAWLRAYFWTPFIHDADSSLRMFNRKVLDEIILKDLYFRELIGSEVVLKTVIGHRMRFKEIPVEYFARKGSSRGMPLGKIPSKILRVLKDLHALKRRFKNRVLVNE